MKTGEIIEVEGVKYIAEIAITKKEILHNV